MEPPDGTGSAVRIRPHGGRLTFGRLTILGPVGSPLDAGIDAYGADVLLTNNLIRGHTHGIRLNEESSSVAVPDVRNNTIASSGGHAVLGLEVRLRG